jgi:micrococcal nuclease
MNMENNNLYWYRAQVLRILDGDTVELTIDLGYTVLWKSTCRFYGIDTPELHDKNPDLREIANNAKEFTKEHLPIGSIILIHSRELDKYGRPLVDIYCGKDNSIHLNAALIDNGLAKPLKY